MGKGGGAGVGAIVGGVIGGIYGGGPAGASAGAAIGGAAGGLLLPGESEDAGGEGGQIQKEVSQQQLASMRRASGNVNALQPQTTEFGKLLAEQALGRAPSIAEAQLKMAMDRNLSQQLAATKANRALNPALASRQISQAASQNAQATAQQSAIDKLQERQAQQQQYNAFITGQQAAEQGAAKGASTSANSLMEGERAATRRRDDQMAGFGSALATVASKFPAKKGDSGGPSSDELNEIHGGHAHGGLIKPLNARMEAYFKGNMVKGDNEKNDIVPAKLSPGEIVLPRTVVADGPEAAAKFVAEILAKEAGNKKSPKGFGAVLEARAKQKGAK